jgi:hypothetical protein
VFIVVLNEPAVQALHVRSALLVPGSLMYCPGSQSTNA